MLSSSINQKQQFQSTVTQKINQYVSKKPKKRRKRRKNLQGKKNTKQNNEALSGSAAVSAATTTTSTLTKMVQHQTIAKNKQYFQHDNRLGQKETQIKQTLFSSSSSTSSATSSFFNKYTTESELLYNEVAKKFKPLNPPKQPTQKAFLKYNHAQRKLKLAKKKNLKKIAAITTTSSLACGNQKICNSQQMANALMPQQQQQLQHCLCFCQHKQSKCHNNTNIMESKSAVLCNANISKLLNSTTTDTTTNTTSVSSKTSTNGIINCSQSLPKILELLQNHTPALLLETLVNNVRLIECNKNELKRYIIIN